ncbi:MAG: hypothetical protein RMJ05_10310 [Thermomicrobium sp.]|nr:hypothetical protein [Thermomicrobium sp.]
MMKQESDRWRARCSPLVNHVIDEYLAGRLSRREFVRRLSVLGVLPSVAAALAACRTQATPTPAPNETPTAQPQPVASPTPSLVTPTAAAASPAAPAGSSAHARRQDRPGHGS